MPSLAPAHTITLLCCLLPPSLLQRLGPEDSQFIYDAAAGNCLDIATHRHGCCVLQRCIDYATNPQVGAGGGGARVGGGWVVWNGGWVATACD